MARRKVTEADKTRSAQISSILRQLNFQTPKFSLTREDGIAVKISTGWNEKTGKWVNTASYTLNGKEIVSKQLGYGNMSIQSAAKSAVEYAVNFAIGNV